MTKKKTTWLKNLSQKEKEKEKEKENERKENKNKKKKNINKQQTKNIIHQQQYIKEKCSEIPDTYKLA